MAQGVHKQKRFKQKPENVRYFHFEIKWQLTRFLIFRMPKGGLALKRKRELEQNETMESFGKKFIKEAKHLKLKKTDLIDFLNKNW